jgi:hypothetical protein
MVSDESNLAAADTFDALILPEVLIGSSIC